MNESNESNDDANDDTNEYTRDKEYLAHIRYLTKQCENHARNYRGCSVKHIQRSRNWNEDKSRDWVKRATKQHNSSYRTKIKHDPEYVNSKNRKKLNYKLAGSKLPDSMYKDESLFHHTSQIFNNWENNRLQLYYLFSKQDFPEKIEKLEILGDVDVAVSLDGSDDGDGLSWKEIKRDTRIYDYSIMRINEQYLFVNNKIK